MSGGGGVASRRLGGGVGEGDREAVGGRTVVERQGERIGGDALDEAGEDLAGPDLDEGRDAGGGHRADGADPVDAGGQVVDELGPAALGGGDRARVGVGEERGLRVVEGDPGEDLAHPCRGIGHQGRVGGDRDRELDGALRAEALRDAEGRLDGRSLAAHHDLAGRVAVRDAEDAVLAGLRDELRQAVVVEADDRGHAPLAARARGLHLLAPDPHQADGVGEVERTGGDEGGVLPHRVAGGERGLRDVDTQLVPALLDGLEVGDRGGEEGRLAVLGPVELLLGTLPGKAGDGLAEGGIGGGEHGCGDGGGLGERAAHADGLAALAGEHEGDLVHQAAG